MIRRSLGQVSTHVPIHLQLGSLSNKDYSINIMNKVCTNNGCFILCQHSHDFHSIFVCLVRFLKFFHKLKSNGLFGLFEIVQSVDSLGLNEQELLFLSQLGGGPYHDDINIRSQQTYHVHKVVDMIDWLLIKLALHLVTFVIVTEVM